MTSDYFVFRIPYPYLATGHFGMTAKTLVESRAQRWLSGLRSLQAVSKPSGCGGNVGYRQRPPNVVSILGGKNRRQTQPTLGWRAALCF
jgi:hypothetical protein